MSIERWWVKTTEELPPDEEEVLCLYLCLAGYGEF